MLTVLHYCIVISLIFASVLFFLDLFLLRHVRLICADKYLFVCRGCVNPVTSTGCTSADIGDNAYLELVNKFCYLCDTLSIGGDADAAMETRIRIGWSKFGKLVPVIFQ